MCSEISDEMVPEMAMVVFDWDNTLKLYDKSTNALSSRVPRDRLECWKREKHCELFIISAIFPSRLNLETLLLEVEKLQILDLFVDEHDVIVVKPGRYARKGNVVICGYDKAETFIELRGLGHTLDGSVLKNEEQGIHVKKLGADNRTVVFFDDEEINVRNFVAFLGNKSICYLVK